MKKYIYVGLGFVLASAVGLLSIKPSLAAQVACALTIACDGGNNSSNGPGVQGNSIKGTGVYGVSKTNVGVRGFTSAPSPGVYGLSIGSGSDPHTVGVYGSSQSVGVGGAGVNDGVQGTSPKGNGVHGIGYIGVVGVGRGGGFNTGVYGDGGTYGFYGLGNYSGTLSQGGKYGLIAQSDGVGLDGVYAFGNDTGVYALGNYGVTGSGFIVGLTGQNSINVPGTAVLAQGNNAAGLLYRGTSSSSGTPTVFTVDDSGNIYTKGQVSATAFVTHATASVAQTTANGSRVTTFAAQQTAPSIEHVGEADLVSGSAIVRFDAAFAATMARGPYMVFITPQGETHGLYVAQKTPSGFVVRENQMGRSNAAFDYRVISRPYSTTRHTDVAASKAWSHGPSIQHRPTIAKFFKQLKVPQQLGAPQ